jgi:hypothetical protein
MKKFTDKINESTFYKKVPSETLKYFDLFPLLRGLESERTGIKKRVWEWMCDECDAASKPYTGRISSINLFFYGIGDEYPNDYLNQYPDELENCKKIHPEAFIEGSKEKELRLDLNLIWSVYEEEIEDPESFSVKVFW